MSAEMIRLGLTLPSGPHADAIISREAIGVAITGRACLAHRRWMTAAQLRQVSEYAAELADLVEGGEPP